MSQSNTLRKKKMDMRTRRHLTFYIAMFILPLIQFSIFYIFVNLSAIRNAFTTYEIDYKSNSLVSYFSGFENFGLAWDLYANSTYVWKTTLISFLMPLVVSQPLTIIISYYIFKKQPLAEFFKVMVFLPTVVSGLVFALIFKYLTGEAYVQIMKDWFGREDAEALLYGESTQLATVVFFNVWMSFGSNLLLFSGAMNSVNESVMEAAEIDGANKLQEFFYVVLPGIFPTYKQLFILSIAGVFSGQLSLMSLYGLHSDETRKLATIGMLFYMRTQGAKEWLVGGISYGVLTAYGLMATAVILPTTLLVRRLLNKYGPSAD